MKKLKEEIRNTLQSLYSPREIQAIQRQLLTSWLAVSDLDYYCDKDTILSAVQRKVFDQMLVRLANSEPIQYVLGYTSFCGHRLAVDKQVLIPRPETEELVKLIELDIARRKNGGKGLNILDIGTGSGAIVISLAASFTQANCWAIDISESALAIAKKNAQACGVSVDFLQQDILESTFEEELNLAIPKLDIIVSNPPYICKHEQSEMDDNVLRHEPHLALFVDDNDALLFYRKIAEHGKRLLTKGGKLFFEINQEFGLEAKQLLENMGYCQVTIIKDLYENDRMIVAENKEDRW